MWKLLEEAVLINKLKTSELIKKNYKNKKFKNISHPETGGVKVSTRSIHPVTNYGQAKGKIRNQIYLSN